ncbi:MAG: PhnD/SsuA/transferrin family substrate-binding protein [Candidatus Solibacter sp.]
MKNCNPAPVSEAHSGAVSRRHALAAMLGAGIWRPGRLAAADAPVRLIVSESLVTDINMNDARAAMQIWIKRMAQDLNVVVEFSPKVFDTTEELLRRTRSGQFDCVALNVVEYRQIADLLDPSQILCEGNAAGPEQYLLLAKRDSGIQNLGDLRGRKLCILKGRKMCVADAWLSTILDEGHFGQSDLFFGPMTAETKASRVVLPLFFGQTDACLTSKRSFDTMCELNPQVAKNLTVIASSPAMVVAFYIFRKNYHGMSRESFAKFYSDLPVTAAGRQIATLFQFDNLMVKDIGVLAPALAVLEKADRARGRQGIGSRKG